MASEAGASCAAAAGVFTVAEVAAEMIASVKAMMDSNSSEVLASFVDIHLPIVEGEKQRTCFSAKGGWLSEEVESGSAFYTAGRRESYQTDRTLNRARRKLTRGQFNEKLINVKKINSSARRQWSAAGGR